MALFFLKGKIMAKVITAQEMSQILTKLLTSNEIDDADEFANFLTDVSRVVTDYCGGEIHNPAKAESQIESQMICIYANEKLPSDGGIWKDYDTDVSVEEWMSEENSDCDKYVIYSASEAEYSDDNSGFWSNDQGWVDFYFATQFTYDETRKLNLPISENSDAKFVSVSFYEYKIDQNYQSSSSPKP